MLYRVADIDLLEVKKNKYDVGIFASGYEQRCTHAAKKINRKYIVNPIVFGFEEYKDNEQRRENDLYYQQQWVEKQSILSADDEGPIYLLLQDYFAKSQGPLKLLVDYSSMSRLWYAGILNWINVAQEDKEVVVDLLYSVGEYRGEYPSMVINDILSIPGCEGSPVPFKKSVAVFGLGFDEYAPLCVLDRLEADEVYAYLADPAVFNEYPRIAREKNKELIKHAKAILSLPLKSVEVTYRYLAEVISPYKQDSNIIFIPMGPKPHILAAILLSMRFGDIVCLRVSGKREKTADIRAMGEVVATRIQFKPRKMTQLTIGPNASQCSC